MHMKQLVGKTAKKMGMNRRETKVVLEAFFAEVQNALAEGRKVTLDGVGTFEFRKGKTRQAAHPQKLGKRLVIPAKRILVFRGEKYYLRNEVLSSALSNRFDRSLTDGLIPNDNVGNNGVFLKM